MRWKLLRRRLSVSAPRVIVRSHLPWPLRWALAAVVLGFCAAIGLWAFEFGKEIAGLDRQGGEELVRLRTEVGALRDARDKAQALAHTADSLLTAERVAQHKLVEQVRLLERDNLSLKADLGFFERLLPSNGEAGLTVRALQADLQAPGRLRYQLLVMQNGKSPAEFDGSYELVLTGQLDARPWTMVDASGRRPLKLQLYARADGIVEHPAAAVVKSAQVRIFDSSGALRASHATRLQSVLVRMKE